ncbi:MAG: PIG-L family deacetylase [Candidatus Omnitrophica bacterium]|nr:PIG-L family deacetylase [Candidatus Omnitrophota bacterium]MDE2231152.1 PIG-L family deacetylase [Candidatus Omnitrophota bacterium]
MLKRFSCIGGAALFLILLGTAAFAAPLKYGQVTLLATDRILVLAPHPDDEVLGTGGIIQQAVALKLPIRVVFLTYGDANEWSFLLYRRHPVVFPGGAESMGMVRHDEAVRADSILGVSRKDLIFLGYPDFGTLNMWYYHWDKRPPYRSILTRAAAVPYKDAYDYGAPYKGESVLHDLRSILKGFRPTKIFVSHPADHNGDHLALYLYLRVAMWEDGLDDNVPVYAYLVHRLGWPQPWGFHPEKNLVPPEALADNEHWLQYHLTPQQFETKETALKAHKSQYFSSRRYLISFVKFNELFAQIPPLKLSLNKNVSVIPGRKKSAAVELPEELNDRLRAAFVGVDWKSLRLEADKLIVTISLSKPLAEDVEASIYFFGYNKAVPFGEMPKINVRLGVLSYSVYDQNKRLKQQVVAVTRNPKEITITVPLKLLGDPQKILTCARTSLGNFPLDNSPWVVLDLQ